MVTLEEAVLRGLAPDGGLYVPVQINRLPEDFLRDLAKYTLPEIAVRVASVYTDEDVPETALQQIVSDSVNFQAPLIGLESGIAVLELFHGPTLAFKDFGARFLSKLLGYFASRRQQEVTILVATSGDTGSAVAQGFHGTPGVNVVILYPKGKVSDLQERQFTTLGGNITALEVEGTFDDCQRMVKQAFADAGLRGKMFLASANSINIVRLIPQVFYYFGALAQSDVDRPVVFCVPSGNFGNLTAGLIAARMGLRVHHWIAATNANDVVPAFLDGGAFQPRSSLSTISNAMDVGNPSNFERMEFLFNHDAEAIRQEITGYSFTDTETESVMKEVRSRVGYLLDPHGAVGYLGLKRYLSLHKEILQGIFLETAHPAKFLDTVERVTGQQIELPEPLKRVQNLEKRSISIGSGWPEFRSWLMSRS